MNIYDKKVVKCARCNQSIGEVDYDAQIILPKCGKCTDPMPEGDDKAMYIASKYMTKKPITLDA